MRYHPLQQVTGKNLDMIFNMFNESHHDPTTYQHYYCSILVWFQFPLPRLSCPLFIVTYTMKVADLALLDAHSTEERSQTVLHNLGLMNPMTIQRLDTPSPLGHAQIAFVARLHLHCLVTYM